MENVLNVYERACTYLSEKDTEPQTLKEYGVELNNLRDFVLQEGYPCIGAQTSINSKSYALGVFDKMDCWRTAKELACGLSRYITEMKRKPSMFMTYIAIFRYDSYETEEDFERSMWNLLTNLNLIDKKNHEWCAEVSDDPTSNNFSYSFGEHAFYIVGMHPNSSRKSRRFNYVSLAFNLHEQFEWLREKGRYKKIQDLVRKNDLEFSGSVNPMLSDFGEGLEAPQYSGRKVGSNWECPFKNSL
ncbi:guanitoxin biosynthesis heme-dependent pre-guanitoxin N-hydroxylase GntA [Maribacter algicola]|nr:guanitoxin biosynthesis heme-dependent pre-guanitoxin N-hydroxylase GntA [Maribacter algicola]